MLELLAPVDVGVGEAPVAPGARKAALEVADQRPLVHAPARLEAVAIEEDVARDGSPLGTEEGIEADALDVSAVGVDVLGTVIVIDMRRAIVDAQVSSQSDHAAGREVVVDIADASARLGDDVPSPVALAVERLPIAPFPRIEEIKRGLVVELRMPAAEGRDIDQQMELGLYPVGERSRSHEAELERELLVLLGVGVLHEAQAAIGPSRVGPVGRVGIDQAAVLGRVDVVPEGKVVAPDHAGTAAATENRQP